MKKGAYTCLTIINANKAELIIQKLNSTIKKEHQNTYIPNDTYLTMDGFTKLLSSPIPIENEK